MYKNILNLMEIQGVKFVEGLTFDEFIEIEKIYEVRFPKSFREFLMNGLPISKGFYNWRDMSNNNVNYIRQVIKQPLDNIYNMAEEAYWCSDWGENPNDSEKVTKEIRRRLINAPILLPIYAYRYMPMIPSDNPPIISIHNLDIIYYGKNLLDYFKIEFGKKQHELIDFRDIEFIPFWTDMM